MQHPRNEVPNLFVQNENSAYVMPHVTAPAGTSCAHRAACAHRQAGLPNKNVVVHEKLLMDMPCMLAE